MKRILLLLLCTIGLTTQISPLMKRFSKIKYMLLIPDYLREIIAVH